ncbi:MAG TPA: hypothetical protein VFF94_07605, partial [Novosphingobium sp.]|nr:hypothetical protein [Novosphingobium sp.]
MFLSRSLLLAPLSALLAVIPGVARAAEPPCLTVREFTAVATYALPDILHGVGAACVPVLGQGAFLAQEGPALADRYAAARPAAWPATRAALARISASQGLAGALVARLPDATQQQLFSTLVAGVVAEKVPAQRCGLIDQILSLIAPLPPENTAAIIGMAVGLGA